MPFFKQVTQNLSVKVLGGWALHNDGKVSFMIRDLPSIVMMAATVIDRGA